VRVQINIYNADQKRLWATTGSCVLLYRYLNTKTYTHNGIHYKLLTNTHCAQSIT